MKLPAVFIFSFLFCASLAAQDNNEHVVTKTYYNKWNVTFESTHLIEFQQGSATDSSEMNGVTILYIPLIMIDDGIYGSVGIILTKEKKPEYLLELSFPVGIGNRSYENLSNSDMEIKILLMSGRDSVLKSVSNESREDQVAVGGTEFKSRLYRFNMNANDFEKLKSRTPNKMQLYYKSKSETIKPKRRPAPGYISSENLKISKFSTFAKSISEVKISEVH
jgi:hypothetical protein